MRAAFALACALAAAGWWPAAGRADAVVADLSSHLVAITTGFTGASVVLFGATDGPGDVIAVVRGPDRPVTVWRKSEIAGIWANTDSMSFARVPSFYAVYEFALAEPAIYGLIAVVTAMMAGWLASLPFRRL